MERTANQELIALTSLRGVAALFVIYHHLMYVLLPNIGYSMPGELFLKSYLWVDLFFILSGFVIAYVYQHRFRRAENRPTYRSFIKSRFARVYPLHLFMLGLFVVYEGVQWLLTAVGADGMQYLATPFTGKQSIESLMTNLFLVQTLHWEAYWNEPAWSISAEWLIYLIMPLVLVGMGGLRQPWLVLLAALAFAPLVWIEQRFGDLGILFAGWPMLLRCLAGAVLGIVMFRWFKAGRFARLASAKLALPVLAVNLVLLYFPVSHVLSVAGFALLVLCSARIPAQSGHILNHSWLHYLGKISYSVYLVHWLFIDLFRDASLFLTGRHIYEVLPAPAQWAMFLLVPGLVILISHWTYHRVELPCRERLKSASFRELVGAGFRRVSPWRLKAGKAKGRAMSDR
ncbi:acyltransferase [Marinobacter sp. chi1]|uniref:Acyltransferase n=1 Tax=Marinobacter suaedae TaxID=3057675 RepID=A0ABT8VZ76_9GAMM|nr:acyltransferase [Marinobacter sp. chi1]MDO3721295.1 acyltransferase [Marinobacter sp. chi1]